MMKKGRFPQLLEQYLSGQLTPEEAGDLLLLLEDAVCSEALSQLVQEQLDTKFYDQDIELPLTEQRIQEHLQMMFSDKRVVSVEKKPKTKWPRYAAAAILILAIGSGVYYLNNQSYKSHKSSQIIVQTKEVQDIQPGSNKAILTFSNGTQKELSPADNGLQLQSDAVLLTTPKGGQYQAILPDGSKVWMNAASSIKFPSVFNNMERRVEVTGEVYFEIIKDANKPFKVYGGDQEIEVLGTAFNVNIYPDEPKAKTSLIEGSIKVNNTILKPGEAWQNGTRIQTNVQQDVAWKNGFFNFNNADLYAVMRQLSRWYDIEVQYAPNVKNIEFNGKLTRDLSLVQVLKILESMDVRFTITGRKLFVTP